MSKQLDYRALVEDRKRCTLCADLVNPSAYKAGCFGSAHVGPWSLWQGNIDAAVVVVGQDWGDTRYFDANRGREATGNPTNNTLRKLLASVGVAVEDPSNLGQRQVAFFTNAILCLKTGGLQGQVRPEWFTNCSVFLRRQVETIAPKVVVTLGEQAFRALGKAFQLKLGPFKAAVESQSGILLPIGSQLVPVYHCGARILNTHRPLAKQLMDWQRVGRALEC